MLLTSVSAGWEVGEVSVGILGTAILFQPLTASLVDLDQQIFDVLDFSFHRLRLVTKLPVLPLQAMKLLLQRVQLRPLTQSVPAIGTNADSLIWVFAALHLHKSRI